MFRKTTPWGWRYRSWLPRFLGVDAVHPLQVRGIEGALHGGEVAFHPEPSRVVRVPRVEPPGVQRVSWMRMSFTNPAISRTSPEYGGTAANTGDSAPVLHLPHRPRKDPDPGAARVLEPGTVEDEQGVVVGDGVGKHLFQLSGAVAVQSSADRDDQHPLFSRGLEIHHYTVPSVDDVSIDPGNAPDPGRMIYLLLIFTQCKANEMET